jgi:hypothetical protein
MELDIFKERLSKYKRADIIFTTHAEIRTLGRGIDLEEVKDNILNPTKLVCVIQQKAEKPNEEKYECYFAYSKTYCHKYVLTLNRKVIIINRDWQKVVKR